MPGRVYTFERIVHDDYAAPALIDAINAITLAAADDLAIRYEAITESDDPDPMVMVMFRDRGAMDTFQFRLTQGVHAWGLRLRRILTEQPQDRFKPGVAEDFDQLDCAHLAFEFDEATSLSATAGEPHCPLEGAQILVVDDEFLIASDLETLFSAAGARVEITTTLFSALGAARFDNLSAALLDVRLGQATSAPVADVLEKRGIPFLFFSAYALSNEMRARFPQARALFKPLNIGNLLNAVEGLLKPHHVASL
jgi:CheY-like chemotaxis protein